MTVFGDYANYYDLLYEEKDYSAETEYICGLIREYAPHTARILDIGSGTGNHAALLADNGFDVHGVDLSETMVRIAEDKRGLLDPTVQERVRFSTADIQELELGEHYDAVVALFHVMSYQTSNVALEKAIASVKQHCHAGGLFIFDFWYGAAVLHEKPELRVKIIERDGNKHVRIASPHLHHSENCVDVDYRLLVLDQTAGTFAEIKERHTMRYLFIPEMEQMLNKAGFAVLEVCQWMSREPPSDHSWSVCMVTRSS